MKSHTEVEYNELADKAARAMVDGDKPPEIIFDGADPPIGGLRTWPQIRQNLTSKPEQIRKITNLKAGIKKELKHTKNPRSKKESMANSYKKRDIRAHTSAYKHAHNPHIDPDATHTRWHGDHTSIDAKRNKINSDQCYAPNVTDPSQTHTS